MLLATLAQVAPFVRPHIDWHAVSPELVLVAGGALVTLVDLIWLERARKIIPTLTGFVFLAAMIPVLTLWSKSETLPRSLWDGAYVVDHYSLILKGLFLLIGYVVVLLSTTYMEEGDYHSGEFYQLMSASILGMLVMASARDLISIFVALELISIPAYLMAAWRKRDDKSNEAGLKYLLMGVFASAILMYGFSLLYGVAADTRLSVIGEAIAKDSSSPLVTLAIVFSVIGFGFKVSAVPFHTWAPDTYEGAPTPLTAFLAVASKTAGFVALINVIMVAFAGRSDVVEPLVWTLSALTMTVGNLVALRQTNIVRMLAYSGIAQAGYVLAPLAVFSQNPDRATQAVVNYLLIYAAMNLGAFAVVLAVARRTRSGEISSYAGLFTYAPGMTLVMTAFLFSLAGIPPVAGWWAKFQIFGMLADGTTFHGITLAIILAVNSVVAAYYYLNVAKQMWFVTPEKEENRPLSVPAPLLAAIAITGLVTIVLGTVGIGPLGDMVSDITLALQ